jgi:hypothetical protein
MLTQNVYSVGTAAQTVVEPTNDVATYVLKNLQPLSVFDYSRDGYVYLLNRLFDIPSNSSVLFSFEAGPTGAQIDFYDFVVTSENVYAQLVEGATITVTGSAIPAYNLNRNKSDAHTSVLKAATAITGGTIISSELVTASKGVGGIVASGKIHTLEANTQYGFRFTNQGNSVTTVHFQMGFSEQYNGYNEIWLGTEDQSFVLRGEEEIKFTLLPNEVINAKAKMNSSRLAVMRQE